jgi:hypothetical protein
MYACMYICNNLCMCWLAEHFLFFRYTYTRTYAQKSGAVLFHIYIIVYMYIYIYIYIYLTSELLCPGGWIDYRLYTYVCIYVCMYVWQLGRQ